jgi:hypothetical protein
MAAHRLLILILVFAGTTAARAQPLFPSYGCTRPERACGIPYADYKYRPRSVSDTAVSRTGVMLRTRTSVVEVLASEPVTMRHEYTDQQVLRHLPGINERHIERDINETVIGSQIVRVPKHTQAELPSTGSPPHEDPVRNDNKPGVTRRVLRSNFTSRSPAPEPPKRCVVELYRLSQAGLKIDHCEISQVVLQLHDDGDWILSLRADQNRRPRGDEPVVYNPRLHIKRNQFIVRLRCLGSFADSPTEAAVAAGKPVLAELHPSPFWVENGQPRYLRLEGWDPWVEEHFAEIDRVEIEFFYYQHHGYPSPMRGP